MIPALIIGGVLLVLVLYLVATYNGLVKKRVQCDNGFSQIDVQLKRRYDLIPNLVETVKGYAAHEKETLEAVISARQAAMGMRAGGVMGDIAQLAAAESVLTGAVHGMFALQENYPDLKANENFLQLQEEITSTENRIAYARQFYNDAVGKLNAAVQMFPTNIIAGMFGFRQREFFEIELDQKEAPQVKLS